MTAENVVTTEAIVNQQTSAADSDSSTVTDQVTADSQTQPGILKNIIVAIIITILR